MRFYNEDSFHPHQKNPFHYSRSEDFPLFSETQIISLLLQKATPLLGFKTKGRGAGGVQGRGWQRTDGEERRYTEKKREMKKGGQSDKKGQRERERDKAERDVSHRNSVCACDGGE